MASGLYGEVIIAVRSIEKNRIVRRGLPGTFWSQGACDTGTVKVVCATWPVVSRLPLRR